MKILYIILFLALPYITLAQHTFSIVAIDTITKEIGSAGATCLSGIQYPPGAKIISDIIPGHGAIHTQAAYNFQNQLQARNRMYESYSPVQIINWLIDNDVESNPGIRQYGIVDLDSNGEPRSAGYTGNNCLNYKNHILGRNYSIQGNILLGQQILDSIKSGFLSTEGTLADKLMTALQGAKVIGADTRCFQYGTSTLSAFVRVAKWNNKEDSLYLDLNVPSLPYGYDPIDSLQKLYDEFKATDVNENYLIRKTDGVEIYSTMNNVIIIKTILPPTINEVKIYDILGNIVWLRELKTEKMDKMDIDISELRYGIYFLKIGESISRFIIF
ncbi:MAG: DUF1028 domain-containing protein [Ignavibacteriae bacterium]|nr:DUF1028 domain-containing protein [Ignavibacteriota bacterium]